MPRPAAAPIPIRRRDPAARAAASALAAATALILGLLAARDADAADTAAERVAPLSPGEQHLVRDDDDPAASTDPEMLAPLDPGEHAVARDPGRDWSVGRPLPDAGAARPLDDPESHGLTPPEAGERYVVFQGEVLRVSGTPEAGLIVIASAGEAAAILD